MNESKYFGIILDIVSGLTVKVGETATLRELADVVGETKRRLEESKKQAAA